MQQPVFKKRYDSHGWHYACPLQKAESSIAAYRRVIGRLIEVIPVLGRPSSARFSSVSAGRIDLDEFPEPIEAWQKTLYSAVPSDPVLDGSIWVSLAVRSASNEIHLLDAATLGIRYSDDPDWVFDLGEAILVSLAVLVDYVYFPYDDAILFDSRQEPSEVVIRQAELNGPSLTAFLSSIGDDLEGELVYRTSGLLGPTGFLMPGESQDGLIPPG